MTNANTMQARRKLRKRWPCQKLRESVWGVGPENAAVAVELLVSFDCSVDSISFTPITLRAIE